MDASDNPEPAETADERPTQAHLDWARSALGVAGNSTVTARVQFMEILANAAFMPHEDEIAAFRVLTDSYKNESKLVNDLESRQLENLKQQALVEEFLDSMFEMDLQQRREQWKLTRNRLRKGTRAYSRMMAASVALDLELDQIDGPGKVNELRDKLAEIFTLSAMRRVYKRAELKAQAKIHQRSEWIKAARFITKRYPGLVKLDPELVKDLVNLKMLSGSGVLQRGFKFIRVVGENFFSWGFAILMLVGVVSAIVSPDDNQRDEPNRIQKQRTKLQVAEQLGINEQRFQELLVMTDSEFESAHGPGELLVGFDELRELYKRRLALVSEGKGVPVQDLTQVDRDNAFRFVGNIIHRSQ